MRNDSMVCDGPITATIGSGCSRRRRLVRGLLAIPLTLALIAPGATALAAEATTGYSQTTPAPKTETTPAPKQETAPTQTSSTAKETPASKTEPTKTSSEPKATTTTTTTTKAKTLPFTGLDLRWLTIGGLLLVGMGLSLVAQRRQGARR